MIPPNVHDPAYRRIRDALLALAFRAPQFLLVWDRIKGRVQIGTRTETMAVDDAGGLYVNPAFLASLSPAELEGVLAHEFLHLILAHHSRRHGRDPQAWNVATDQAINYAIREDGYTLPAGALYPPADYTGPVDAESLYELNKANPAPQPQPGRKGKPSPGKGQDKGQDKGPGERQDAHEGQGEGEGEGGADEGQDAPPEPLPGQGCGVRPAPAGSDAGAGDAPGQLPGALRPGETWSDVRALAEATLDGIGAGSSAIRRLLAPTPSRANWRALLRRGAQIAQASRERETPTYARASRRQVPGVIRAGWRGTSPRLGVILDVSGSMDRSWLDQVVGECLAITKLFQGVQVYVVSHTDRVTWEGWIHEGRPQAWADAISATGGTFADPAYEAIDRVPGPAFDCVIHFTDCELHRWPRCARAKRHLIGACGPGANGSPFCPFPSWAEVVPVVQ